MTEASAKLNKELYSYMLARVALTVSKELTRQQGKEQLNLNAIGDEVLQCLGDLNKPVVGMTDWKEFVELLRADYGHVSDFEKVASSDKYILGF